MLIFYDLFSFIFCLLYFPYLVIRRKWHGQFPERLGRFSPGVADALSSTKNIWVHAVSVGEVMVVKKFIVKLKERYPEHHIVLTTVTQTGFGIAQTHLRDQVTVMYAPLDFSFVVRRFIEVINPLIYVTAETEIWPNLWSALGEKNIPLVIVNGRISDKSFGGYRKIRFLLKSVISRVGMFCMQSETDAGRIKQLGASGERVIVTGNMKFDDLIAGEAPYPDRLGFNESRRIWIAGSTHPGEEEAVCDVYKRLKDRFPDLGLIIAPRHPERKDEIMVLIREKGLSSVLFSAVTGKDQSHDHVVVVDTIGQLKFLYELADVVFVGKSLTVGGGHNIIEPASFAKPILVGPRMDNFKDIIRLFVEQGAVIQVKDKEDLARRLGGLLENPEEMRRLGRCARRVVAANRGATDRTVDILERNFKF